MARLNPGENEKIDKINSLVKSVMETGNEEDLKSLLDFFHPLILSLSIKWAEYYNDMNHRIIPWEDLISEAQCWFIKYTKEKYEVDGAGTYNTFIKQHMDSRIRYIYSCASKYDKRHIFPDPDKRSDEDDDMLNSVLFRYSTEANETMTGDMCDGILVEEHNNNAKSVVNVILSKLDDRTIFNEREKEIFTLRYIKNMSHDDIARKFGISRARISQIMAKMKVKLHDVVLNSQYWWDLEEDI